MTSKNSRKGSSKQPYLQLVLGSKGRKMAAPEPTPPLHPHPVRVAQFFGGTMVQCEKCQRWGREEWPHTCNGVHWFISPEAVRVAESAHFKSKRPFMSGRKSESADGPLQVPR